MTRDQLPPRLGDGLGQQQEFAAVLDASGKLSVVVDGVGGNGAFLLTADFVRSGPDLILVGPDGAKVLIVNYFASETAPDLYTLNGAQIPGGLASVLAGPSAEGLAQTGGDLGAPIGVVEDTEGTVFASRTDGNRVELKPGDPI